LGGVPLKIAFLGVIPFLFQKFIIFVEKAALENTFWKMFFRHCNKPEVFEDLFSKKRPAGGTHHNNDAIKCPYNSCLFLVYKGHIASPEAIF